VRRLPPDELAEQVGEALRLVLAGGGNEFMPLVLGALKEFAAL
jgi:hypothetical protein